MIIIETEERAVRNSVDELVVARNHDPQPCSTALSKGDDRDIRAPQATCLFAATQPSFKAYSSRLRQKERQGNCNLAAHLLEDRIHREAPLGSLIVRSGRNLSHLAPPLSPKSSKMAPSRESATEAVAGNAREGETRGGRGDPFEHD